LFSITQRQFCSHETFSHDSLTLTSLTTIQDGASPMDLAEQRGHGQAMRSTVFEAQKKLRMVTKHREFATLLRRV
jgi:hypothetical protein